MKVNTRRRAVPVNGVKQLTFAQSLVELMGPHGTLGFSPPQHSCFMCYIYWSSLEDYTQQSFALPKWNYERSLDKMISWVLFHFKFVPLCRKHLLQYLNLLSLDMFNSLASVIWCWYSCWVLDGKPRKESIREARFLMLTDSVASRGRDC